MYGIWELNVPIWWKANSGKKNVYKVILLKLKINSGMSVVLKKWIIKQIHKDVKMRKANILLASKTQFENR